MHGAPPGQSCDQGCTVSPILVQGGSIQAKTAEPARFSVAFRPEILYMYGTSIPHFHFRLIPYRGENHEALHH
ncbi:MAG: hypothetical protein OZSIB_2984 [Candidatus Ozemobacter sibiricus]|uniref:Uncharacterized protein n=1 Tax=Candidatus Ozemobacter sibiricus TaxID=2268124 RepID=A0A367ZTK4_9BACT|nr:MAG: hypothetical protein OZSIB_2984 [Candidatus Ozemobacter sibiricus]